MLKVEIVRKNKIKQPYKVNQEGNRAQESEWIDHRRKQTLAIQHSAKYTWHYMRASLTLPK